MNNKEISCPLCKSIDIIFNQIRRSNKILGPGYRSWIESEYYTCKECGTMFNIYKGDEND